MWTGNSSNPSQETIEALATIIVNNEGVTPELLKISHLDESELVKAVALRVEKTTEHVGQTAEDVALQNAETYMDGHFSSVGSTLTEEIIRRIIIEHGVKSVDAKALRTAVKVIATSSFSHLEYEKRRAIKRAYEIVKKLID
jgi:hypothetical protein